MGTRLSREEQWTRADLLTQRMLKELIDYSQKIIKRKGKSNYGEKFDF